MKIHQYARKNTCEDYEQNLEAFHFVDKRKLLNVWKDNFGEDFVNGIPETERQLYQHERINLYARYIEQLSDAGACNEFSGTFIKKFKHRVNGDLKSLYNFLYARLAVVFYFGVTILFGFTPKNAIMVGLSSLAFYFLYFTELGIFHHFLVQFTATFGDSE